VEHLIDVLHVEGNVLRLGQKLLRALDILLQSLERGIWQTGEILRLIDEHLRFILKRGDLVVDLLQRACGSQKVLRIVGRIIDDAAEAKSVSGACQHGRQCNRHGERQRRHGCTDISGNGDTDHGRVSFSWLSSGWI